MHAALLPVVHELHAGRVENQIKKIVTRPATPVGSRPITPTGGDRRDGHDMGRIAKVRHEPLCRPHPRPHSSISPVPHVLLMSGVRGCGVCRHWWMAG